MTFIVGITGGIGSGKTTFSKQVLKRGLKLLDSDKVVGGLYKVDEMELRDLRTLPFVKIRLNN